MNARVYEYVCEHVTSLADFIEKKHELIKERQQVPLVVKLGVKLVVKHELIKERQQVDLKAAYTSSLRPHTLVA
jgi:hypothetical protein